MESAKSSSAQILTPHVCSTALRAQTVITMPPPRSEKVRAVRTSSKPSATSAASGLAPDDWIWNALDIARRAAMADDLEHVPSIKAIADIFTRMLERLQVGFTSCSERLMCSFFKGKEKE